MTLPIPSAGARRAVAVVAAAVFAATGCSETGLPSGIDPVASASVVMTVPPPIGPEGCDPGSPALMLDLGLEVEGAVDGRDELWALFTAQELRAGEPVDVYWRVGGDKTMRITLVGPNDRVVPAPAPRPQPYVGWDRPGEPWLGTMTFPQSGCWRVHVERARVRGDLWLVVD